MWSDAIELRDFYRTSLGQMTRRIIRQNVRTIWPDLRGMNLLGIGYATPYLLPYRDEAARTIAVMPAPQGVLRWPPEGANLVTLAEEGELPLPDLSIDRVMLVHALESSEQLRAMLRELWRVMADDGRLLAVVPNRRGIWARLDRTPFGHGHPYSQGQMARLLRETMFNPLRSSYGLFVPPSRRRVLVSSAPAWERIGARWCPRFGGILLVEAAKQIYAAAPGVAASRRRRGRAYAPVPDAANGGASASAEYPCGSLIGDGRCAEPPDPERPAPAEEPETAGRNDRF